MVHHPFPEKISLFIRILNDFRETEEIFFRIHISDIQFIRKPAIDNVTESKTSETDAIEIIGQVHSGDRYEKGPSVQTFFPGHKGRITLVFCTVKNLEPIHERFKGAWNTHGHDRCCNDQAVHLPEERVQTIDIIIQGAVGLVPAEIYLPACGNIEKRYYDLPDFAAGINYPLYCFIQQNGSISLQSWAAEDRSDTRFHRILMAPVSNSITFFIIIITS